MASNWQACPRTAGIARTQSACAGTTTTGSSPEVPMLSKALMEKLLAFRRERDGEQFHNLRTLSTSIVLEDDELAEITQWAQDSELAEKVTEQRCRIEEEVADIEHLLLYP